MERLYTPWRMKYVTSTQKKMDKCVFCVKLNDSPEYDRDNLVVYRSVTAFVIMNLYPYNTGHLMVVPNDHVASLSRLSFETQAEMMALTSFFVDLLSQVMNPDGFNVGMNLGRIAGAGIDSHLHLHIVPRWSGDSNFMPVIGNTRVLPEALGDTYDKIMVWLRQHPPELPDFLRGVS